MVWTRSMATSLGHQESGNASSHPNHAHQSAPIMQLPFVEQMQSMAATMSRPKPDTWICDHDRHANIKPKPDINKNQLNFYKSFPLSFKIFASLLKRYNLSLDIQSIYIVLQRIT